MSYQGSFQNGKELHTMSEKRRDNKGRILRTGESQRKDGRYAYKYIDAFGKQQFVYSWKLVATDKTPAGKRELPALRDKIKEISRDLEDGIDTIGKKMTVCQLYAKQNGLRKNVKHGTKKGRDYLMGLLQDDPFGMKSIDAVKQSDAKEWAIRMSEKGFAFQTISNFKRSLKAALTAKQEESLLAFMEQDTVYRKYRDEVIILLGTGLRISEFCGLTTALDFKNRQINVDHQLLRDADIGYYIETPKTKNGIRQIPMSREVYQALKRVLKNRGNAAPFSVEGYKNFLFLKNDGMPKVSANYDSMLKGLVKKYNKQNKEQLPNITPHILRHTFCTRLANAGMNPKALQYIMGHANITMTLNYYAHATYDSAKAEMERLAA